jgi:hypothetical protein
MQDYIAMVLVWYATEQNATLANELNEDNISAKLSLIEKNAGWSGFTEIKNNDGNNYWTLLHI